MTFFIENTFEIGCPRKKKYLQSLVAIKACKNKYFRDSEKQRGSNNRIMPAIFNNKYFTAHFRWKSLKHSNIFLEFLLLKTSSGFKSFKLASRVMATLTSNQHFRDLIFPLSVTHLQVISISQFSEKYRPSFKAEMEAGAAR